MATASTPVACPTDDPTYWKAQPGSDVAPETTIDNAGPGAPTYLEDVYIPALNVTVKDASGLPQAGATVYVTPTNPLCGTTVTATTGDGTNPVGNPVPKGQLPPASTGFPYGTYNICAKLGTKVGKVTNIDSKDKDGTDMSLSLTSSGSCP